MKKEITQEIIQELPESLRPYERIEKCGASALSDAELLSIILVAGTKEQNVLDMAGSILTRCQGGNITGLKDLSFEELQETKGMGKVKALRILALCELSKRLQKKVVKGRRYGEIKVVGKMLVEEMGYFTQEVFRVVVLDKKLQIVGMKDIFVGSVDSAPVHPREIFCEAVRRLGTNVILAHNHPSGDITPSYEDMEVTKRMILAGSIMEIDVVDHIIVGNDSYYSMQGHGMINKMKLDLNKEFSGRI